MAIIRHVLKNGCEVITSKFGYRKDPFTGSQQFHQGIDIVSGYKPNIRTDNIVAFADGKVIELRSNVPGKNTKTNLAGNYVIIDHGNGYKTRYQHMEYKKVFVTVGQKVKKGDIIGYMGTTGYSTGNHLHFDVVCNGTRVDPLPFLEGKKSVVPTVEKPIVKPVVSKAPKTHKVKSGDTLWGISRKYQVSINDLVKWNKIEDPNVIKVGTVLSVVPTVEKPVVKPVDSKAPKTHKVKSGDTLWGISRKYQVSVNDILKWNKDIIKDPNVIKVGWVLKVS